MELIRLAAINDQTLVHLSEGQGWVTLALSDCIALLNPQAETRARTRGMLVLADGQRLPGEAMLNADSEGDALAWSHPWLGRIDVPLKSIESVLLTPDVKPPAPGQADVVLLANGDRQEGFIVALGNPISLEVERDGARNVIDIPLERVVAVTMVSPKQPVAAATKRIWFDEGTVLDVQSIAIGDDGFVRLTGAWLASGTQPTRVSLGEIAAVLFDPSGMIPLASLAPTRLEGPATRYVLPKPETLDPDSPLALSRLELRGPIVARYALPNGCERFTAEAALPEAARDWGDYELIIRTDDDEVFRAKLNGESPTANVNVAVTGRELTIELTPGARGAIQDRLILTRAMLLKKR